MSATRTFDSLLRSNWGDPRNNDSVARFSFITLDQRVPTEVKPQRISKQVTGDRQVEGEAEVTGSKTKTTLLSKHNR